MIKINSLKTLVKIDKINRVYIQIGRLIIYFTQNNPSTQLVYSVCLFPFPIMDSISVCIFP